MLLPLREEGQSHDFRVIMSIGEYHVLIYKDTPLTHPDLVLFQGPTVKMKTWNYHADYAVTNQCNLPERENLSQGHSSQEQRSVTSTDHASHKLLRFILIANMPLVLSMIWGCCGKKGFS